jgi:hypothetical protein
MAAAAGSLVAAVAARLLVGATAVARGLLRQVAAAGQVHRLVVVVALLQK